MTSIKAYQKHLQPASAVSHNINWDILRDGISSFEIIFRHEKPKTVVLQQLSVRGGATWRESSKVAVFPSRDHNVS